ncbi:MAG: HAMP domain-containing protein [Planctomycetes bacterium]|nr:HAMP domain-containing protein [Planctomycetota bacterium]
MSAILASVAVLFAFEYSAMEALLERDLESISRVSASNCTAALTFDDPQAANDTLSALSAKPAIEAAGLYDKEGRLFASYRRADDKNTLPERPGSDGLEKASHLTLIGPVMLKQERIGTIYVRSDFSTLSNWIGASAWVFAGVVLATALAALLLSSLLQKPFLAPIVELADIARQVSAKKDYSLRAAKHAEDELGLLVEKFNEMLAQIQTRDSALEQARDELEVRVQERTRDLQETNKELEAFSYSVAHDLRAPLRGIDGFSQVLLEDYGPRLDETGQEHLQRVRSATQRMAQLLDDLLSRSKVTRSTLRPSQVDLHELANAVLADLRRQNPERQVEVTVDAPLIAKGDPGLLRIVLDNLLGNAWKFTSKKERARIEFGKTQADGASVFFLRDNGAGFDMAYAAKLFTVFHRLHKASDFPGTGVGLATVQRIVQRHGGRIWAESALEQGTTFYFTLPNAEERP